ncbi:type VI lipase adapter Tla3 domain-containing protein, partial [Paraburkholderia bryophila]
MTTPLTPPASRWLFLFPSGLAILTLAWIGVLKLSMINGYLPLEDTSMIRRLLLLTLPPVLLAGGLYAGYSAWARKDVRQVDPVAVRTTTVRAEAVAVSSPRDPHFTLEIRRFGVTVDRFRQRAMLMRLDEAGASGTLLLQEPKEYPYTGADRAFVAGQRENNVFGYTLRRWVDFWPIPVIVAGPDLSVILWARHIMKDEYHGYADHEKETYCGLS